MLRPTCTLVTRPGRRRDRTALVLLAAAVVVPLVALATASAAYATWVSPLPLAAGGPARGFEAPPHRYGPGHRGVDVRAGVGMRVRAAGTGTVSFAGVVAGRPVVSVDHDGGLRTTYEPVLATLGAGASVEAGSVIGRLVAAASHCAPEACLHWGLRAGPGHLDYLDPLSLLAAGPAGLLPVGAAPPPPRYATLPQPPAVQAGDARPPRPDRETPVVALTAAAAAGLAGAWAGVSRRTRRGPPAVSP